METQKELHIMLKELLRHKDEMSPQEVKFVRKAHKQILPIRRKQSDTIEEIWDKLSYNWPTP